MVELVAEAADEGVVVVGLAGSGDDAALVGVPECLRAEWEEAFGRPLSDVLRGVGASSKPGTCVVVPTRGALLAASGLGASPDAEAVRRACGAALAKLTSLPGVSPLDVTLSLSDAVASSEILRAAVEGALLGAYRFRRQDAVSPLRELRVVADPTNAAAARAVEEAETVARSVCLARDWVNTSANILYPQTFAEAVADQASTCDDLAVEIWDDEALRRDGFGGILAVGGGSQRPPRLVKLSYSPAGAAKHLALVGKGITFDSGGLNLKPSDSMYTMKHDMTGAASVFAATLAIAELGLPVKVTAWGAMAENMPSGSAYRPSDVLTMYNRLTVENANSDAEGRLVLADAIAKAAEDSPDLLVDVATLTGACIVALGERTAGLMSDDDQAAQLVLAAARAAREEFWRLPIPEEASDKLKSQVADLKSSGDRHGGALTAAAFLREFVPDGVGWVHLDIAGTAFNTHSPYYYIGEGATGMSIRTLIALASSLAS
ncbi:MAG: leucyl aminopeptidase [Propionibacteriaceae bacterium]|nr:leucyl aminopeptidase [Propionibacteriaceae bacterium]